MKSTSFLLILCLILTVSFSCNPKVPKVQKVHTITLNVETGKIVKPNIDPFCNFGQPASISNKDYAIKVDIGDIVIWEGVSSSSPSTDTVNITSINHQGGVNVFGRNLIRGNGDSPEIVIGKVLKGAPGDEDKYAISFTVYNNGIKRNGTFRIDPKLIINI